MSSSSMGGLFSAYSFLIRALKDVPPITMANTRNAIMAMMKMIRSVPSVSKGVLRSSHTV